MHDETTLFPAKVADRLGLDPNAMATIEVTLNSAKLYKAILQYATCHAVPLDASLESVNETNNGNQKEHKTALRSLWNLSSVEGHEMGSDSDLESDEEANEECDEGVTASVRADLAECGLEVSATDHVENVFGKGCGLRKMNTLPNLKWHAGLGYAKAKAGDAEVYLRHYTLGEPVGGTMGVYLFRAITLVATDIELLKEFCATTVKWVQKNEQKFSKEGRYLLYRFKIPAMGTPLWEDQGYKRARPANTVILPKGQLQSIIRDIQEFMSTSTKEWYQKHGLPHRRSLLFHGIPGSGKTSSIRVLAGLFRLNACFLSLTGHNFDNQALQDAISQIPDRALLVVEDCDALFREDRKTEGATALTFSAFLNCLDGLSSTDGIITILTTNHIEKLDPALIRGGRVDRRFEFLPPDQVQIADLFLSFYKDAARALAVKFAKRVLERKETEARCIATLQQHFIYTRKRSAEECIEALPEFFAEFYPKGADQRQSLYI